MANVIQMDMDALDKLMKDTEQAAQDMRAVHKKLSDANTGLVPDKWDGDAARAFAKDMDVALAGLDKMTQAVEKTPATIERMVKRIAEGHNQSRRLFVQIGQVFGGGGAAGGTAGGSNP